LSLEVPFVNPKKSLNNARKQSAKNDFCSTASGQQGSPKKIKRKRLIFATILGDPRWPGSDAL
jgi:hypothetical protein